MNKLLLFLSVSILTACSGGGSDSSASVDPMIGDWYYVAPGSSSVKARGTILKIEKDKFFAANLYVYNDGSSVVYYYRKSEGTYTKNGKQVSVTYTYETCNAIGSEVVDITAENDKLIIYDPKEGTSIQMLRSKPGETTASSIAAKEDRGCNILTKMSAQNGKDSKRSVANSKKDSLIFFK